MVFFSWLRLMPDSVWIRARSLSKSGADRLSFGIAILIDRNGANRAPLVELIHFSTG
jgi:hypothetical protein